MDCLGYVFKWVLHQFFLHLLRGFSTCFESKYFQSKGEFIKSFQSDFFEFFTTHSILIFLTNT